MVVSALMEGVLIIIIVVRVIFNILFDLNKFVIRDINDLINTNDIETNKEGDDSNLDEEIIVNINNTNPDLINIQVSNFTNNLNMNVCN